MRRWSWPLVALLIVLAGGLTVWREARQTPPGPDVALPADDAAPPPADARTTTRPARGQSPRLRLMPSQGGDGTAEAPTAGTGPGGRPTSASLNAIGLHMRGAPPPSSGSGVGGRPSTEAEEPPPLFAASADGIREAIGFLRYDFRECYEAWQKMQPELAGKIKVRFIIRADEPGVDGQAKGDGATTNATVHDVQLVESSLQHTPLEGCVVSALQSLTFEPPADGQLAVTYPLTFASE